jgi:hypothetical protein
VQKRRYSAAGNADWGGNDDLISRRQTCAVRVMPSSSTLSLQAYQAHGTPRPCQVRVAVLQRAQ